jgi:c-di-GMP-binding flagellar brake protein YcgR
MKERRKQKRLKPDKYVNVVDMKTNEIFGRLADISPVGIMVVGGGSIAVDGTYNLKLVLPEGIDEKTEISFETRSIWCKKDDDSPNYKAGFELIKVSPAVGEAIERLIRNRQFQKSVSYIPTA